MSPLSIYMKFERFIQLLETRETIMKSQEKQLKMGIQVEKEHKSTVEKIRKSIKDGQLTMSDEDIYKSIASDHIAEHKNYYTKLLSLGL